MSHRLFIGLRPPPPVRAVLVQAMHGIEDARWQDDAQLHMTLRYLGEVPRAGANDLAEALSGIRMQAFTVAIEGVGHFERKGAARAVWARVRPAEPLSTLKRKIDRLCGELGHAPDHRKYLPHITLARLNMASGPIGGFLARTADLHPPAFTADHFMLFESHLGKEGSVYEPVARYPLG